MIMKKQSKIFSFVLISSIVLVFLVGIDNVAPISAETEVEFYSYEFLNVPHYPVAINDVGDVLGTIERDSHIYCTGVHACLYHYKKGDLNILNGPSDWYSFAADIDNDNQILGMTYWDGSMWSDGFIYDEGSYNLIDIPSPYHSVWLTGLNNNSELVGTYRVTSYDDYRSFYRDGDGEITILHDEWEVTGINDKGDIIFKQGYLLSEGNYYEIELIDNPIGINNAGEIIGHRGELLRRDGSVISFSVPNSSSTYLYDINNLGEVLLSARFPGETFRKFYIARPILARLVDQRGDVKVNHHPAETAHLVHARDHVEVGDNGLATFMMVMGNAWQDMINLYLGANTEIKQSDSSTTYDHSLEFFQGKLRTVIDEMPEGTSFEILTPVAQTATRGTEWIIEGDENHMIVTVLSGSVEVTSLDGKQTIILEENQELHATTDGLGEAYQIDPDEIDDWWSDETQEEYSLTVDVSPVNSGMVVIDPDKNTYHPGDDVSVTAIPNPGWKFTSWSGDEIGTDNPLTLEIQNHTNITANFAKSFELYLPMITH